MHSPSLHMRLIDAEYVQPNQACWCGKIDAISHRNPRSHIIICRSIWLGKDRAHHVTFNLKESLDCCYGTWSEVLHTTYTCTGPEVVFEEGSVKFTPSSVSRSLIFEPFVDIHLNNQLS